ncbi:MAG: hypothetical protein ACE5GS_10425 [Kiloniellaceae bacterium]
MTKLASLTRSLLTRKGLARPMLAPGPSVRAVPPSDAQAKLATRNWAPAAAGAAAWARRVGAPGSTPKRGIAPARARPGKRIRVSLRLDRDRHEALGRLCAFRGCTRQALLVKALDEFLIRHAIEEPEGDRRRPRPE